MKVMHIFYSLKYSGAEIMYVDAASIFQEKGCELFAVATAKELGEFAVKFEEVGYKVFHKPAPYESSIIKRLLFYFEFATFLKKESIDIVHIHSSKAMWGMALSAWLANKKSIYTFHNVFPTKLLTKPFHILRRLSAKKVFKCKFHTISDSVYNNELNTFKNLTTKIDNWYGSNRYYKGDLDEKLTLRKNLGIDESSFVIVSVGGCSPVKRHSDIIKALPTVNRFVSNCLYLHLGTGVSEDEEMKLASKLDVSVQIMFLGNQSDVRKYLIVSDLYLMPSKFEGLPITTIEAMGCGIPTCLYDVPGLKDFNNEVVTTTLIEEDFNILAETIVDFYKEKNKYIYIANEAKKYVDKKYSMRNNSNKIYNMYLNK